MKRLWVQLTLAFGLVTLTATAIAMLLANYQVSTGFRSYVVRNQMMQSTLLPALADYYATTGSWAGVEDFIGDFRGPGMGRGRGAGQSNGLQLGRPSLQLADAGGRLIYPDAGGQLTAADSPNVAPIQVQGQTVGYLLAEAGHNQVGLSPSEQAFLNQLNRSLLLSGLAAGVLAIGLGLFIAWQLSAPLGRLAAAAGRISRGELSQRVPEQGAQEIAEVAHAFNDMAANLEQAEQLRRNLVADIAHELRTPLSVVQGNLRAILDDIYPLDKEEIASIYDETLTLNRLITDLRELAQAEAGQLSLNLDAVSLSPLISGMADRFQELAREKSITLTVDLPAVLPPLQADSDRVRQVLHNFLSNAIRHTPAGGNIDVAAQVQPAAVRVSVTDTGAGIAPADLPHVFNRFYRADKSRARDQGGSGLGLAIAKQLVEAHGGQVGAASEPGRGSTFWFSLPRTAPQA